MITLRDVPDLLKLIAPFVKQRARSLVYPLIRRQIYTVIFNFVSRLEDNPVFLELGMSKEIVAEYLVKILLGEEISVKDKMKLSKISDIIRAGIYG